MAGAARFLPRTHGTVPAVAAGRVKDGCCAAAVERRGPARRVLDATLRALCSAKRFRGAQGRVTCRSLTRPLVGSCSPGTWVRHDGLPEGPEFGVVIHCWDEGGFYDCYVAFFGDVAPTGRPAEKPYVLRYASTSLTKLQTATTNELLYALAWMAEQYLGKADGELDHLCMSAGEKAVEILARHGLVRPDGRGGTWTQARRAVLDGSRD